MKIPIVTVCPGDRVRLAKIDPAETGGLDREAAIEKFVELRMQIAELQEILMQNMSAACCSFFKRWTREERTAQSKALGLESALRSNQSSFLSIQKPFGSSGSCVNTVVDHR